MAPDRAHVGVVLAAPGDLVDDERPDGVAEGLAHRAGRAHERAGPPEQLVRALEEAQRLPEVALPGGPPPEDVEREAERREVASPGAVADLGGPRGVGLQGLDGTLVLLAMLDGEVKEPGLDQGDEPGQRLDDLIGRPKGPLDSLVHARSLQLSSTLSLKIRTTDLRLGWRDGDNRATPRAAALAPPPPCALPTDLDRMGPPGRGRG